MELPSVAANGNGTITLKRKVRICGYQVLTLAKAVPVVLLLITVVVNE